MTLSQLMTLGSGNPCSGPTATSERIPLIVRVIGAHVTEPKTATAASRVRTQTGLRPAGGPRSAHTMSLRATTLAQSAQRAVVPTEGVRLRVDHADIQQ